MAAQQPSASSAQTFQGTSASARQKFEDLDFPFCPEANKYEKLTKIGQGTFGFV